MKSAEADLRKISSEGEKRTNSDKSDPVENFPQGRETFPTLKGTNPQLVLNLAQGGYTKSDPCLISDEGERTDNRNAENGYMEGKDKFQKKCDYCNATVQADIAAMRISKLPK